MDFQKDGKKRSEFWPQDLANDEAGQKQASQLVRSIRLQRALEKAGYTADQAKQFVRLFNNRLVTNSEPLQLEMLFKVPLDLTEEEKEVFKELQHRILGY